MHVCNTFVLLWVLCKTTFYLLKVIPFAGQRVITKAKGVLAFLIISTVGSALRQQTKTWKS